MPRLVSTKSYDKRLVKFIKKHPSLLTRYSKTVSLLAEDPFHPSLRLHQLQGRMRLYHSVSINMQYRIVIDFVIKDDVVILLDIGSHEEVYGKKS